MKGSPTFENWHNFCNSILGNTAQASQPDTEDKQDTEAGSSDILDTEQQEYLKDEN